MRSLVVLLAIFGCSERTPPPDGGADAGRDEGPDINAPDAPADVPVDVGRAPEPIAASAPWTQYVDPLIGSAGLGFGVGSVAPTPRRPFGMVRPGPDTAPEADGRHSEFDHCAGYRHGERYVRGFSQMHAHGMGIAEYGVLSLMPRSEFALEEFESGLHLSELDLGSESAGVGRYQVSLAEGIEVDITAGERVALHRYRFPASASEHVVHIDAGHTLAGVEITAADLSVSEQEARGSLRFSAGYSGRFGGQRIYFVMRMSEAPTRVQMMDGGEEVDGPVESPRAGAALEFGSDEVEIRVAVSFVDIAHAEANLDAEAGDFEAVSFEDVLEGNIAAWEALLSRAQVSMRSERELRIFYTALYNALAMPTLGSDSDGSYRGLDGEVHELPEDGPARYLTDLSLWDTFRTQIPLLNFLFPDLSQDLVRSLILMGRDGGAMPRWPLGTGYTGGMVGDSATLVVTDAWRKGMREFDLAEAYALLRETAFGRPRDTTYGGRRAIESYLERGYVGLEEANWSGSATMEFSYNDWALSLLATELERGEDAAALAERSKNYLNLWDPAVEFFRGRNPDGSFSDDFREGVWQDEWAEGNARQYLWYAPHDLLGLAARLGGVDATITRLDEFFAQSHLENIPAIPRTFYWHGNEPDIHAPWIYAALDRPEGTWREVRWVVDEFYNDTPDGIAGNDDSGTLSSWYVFAALGLYPITGADYYLVGSPLVTSATLAAPDRALQIVAPDVWEHGVEIDEVQLDEVALTRARVDHAALWAGDTLRFVSPD